MAKDSGEQVITLDSKKSLKTRGAVCGSLRFFSAVMNLKRNNWCGKSRVLYMG
jgi:hypothetical protein